MFDPPYFDFISYSELSEFYRAWLLNERLGGLPLLPNNGNPVASFGMRFARAMRAALARLAPGRPLAFTYHAGRKEAWDAVALGLDNAGLLVTAIWPVRNDGHMGHHTAAGNCEWDAVVVCRRALECVRVEPNLDVREWRDAVRPLTMRKADVEALQLAVSMASQRFGEPRGSGGDC
jgi:adenine-specific DNA methylase